MCQSRNSNASPTSREAEVSGIISEAALAPLQTSSGFKGLRRLATSIREVRNAPLGLFREDFIYNWQRVGQTDSFELDLGIPADEEVECKSLEKLANELRANGPQDPSDIRCTEFDFIIGFLLQWIKRLRDNNYRHLGLITPQNIFILRWPGWVSRRNQSDTGEPEVPRPGEDLRVVLADLGFWRKAGGMLPPWLEPTSHYKFLWDAEPESACTQEFDARRGIPTLARLLAYVLEPSCGVQDEKRWISGRALQKISGQDVASIWKVLDRALAGGYDDGQEGDTGLDTFIQDVREARPSLHFLYRQGNYRTGRSLAETPVTRPAVVDPEPPKSGGSKLIRFAAAAAILLLAAGAIYYLYGSLPGPLCACCPDIARGSPILQELQGLDKLRLRAGAVRDDDFSAGDGETSQPGADSAEIDAPLPIRQNGDSVELQEIVAAHESLQHVQLESPNSLPHCSDVQCLAKLRAEYYTLLANEYQAAINRLRGGIGSGGVLMLCTIDRDLQELRRLDPSLDRGAWEKGFQVVKRRYRRQMHVGDRKRMTEAGEGG